MPQLGSSLLITNFAGLIVGSNTFPNSGYQGRKNYHCTLGREEQSLGLLLYKLSGAFFSSLFVAVKLLLLTEIISLGILFFLNIL